MTKRKNLYIKIETKLQIPKDSDIDNIVDRILKRELLENNNQPLNHHTPEELEQLRKDIKEHNTIHNHQLRKLKNISALNNFVMQNIEGVKSMGQPILLKQEHYDDLLKKSGISSVPYLHIWANSETVFCTIHPISKELLQNALKNEQLTVDRYEELIEKLEEKNKETVKFKEEDLGEII